MIDTIIWYVVIHFSVNVTELRRVFQVREMFHMEQFTLMVGYDPIVSIFDYNSGPIFDQLTL